MKKPFAFGEAVGLSPFRAQPPEPQPRGPLRREVAIDTAVSGGEGRISWGGGADAPPPPSKPQPSPGLTPSCGGSHSPGEALRSPALRCAQRGASVATGCCARARGGGESLAHSSGSQRRGHEGASRELARRDSSQGKGLSRHPARRRDVPQRKGRAVGERVGVLADEELVVRLSSS